MDLIYRYDPFLPARRIVPANAEEALEALRAGNARFAEIVARMQRETLGDLTDRQMVIPVSPLSLGLPLWTGGSPAQAPFALVLGCADARVPVEPIFDQAFNDLFVVRIAGNVLGVECLGSIDYAVRTFADSLKLVVVLGHSGCGAVSAAVDMYINPRDHAEIACTHALRSLIDRIHLAVRNAAKAIERICGHTVVKHAGYRQALIETAVLLNAAITAFDLRREMRALENPDLRVVYGVYNLDNMRVHGAPRGDGGADWDDAPLDEAPDDAEAFLELGTRLVRYINARGTLG